MIRILLGKMYHIVGHCSISQKENKLVSITHISNFATCVLIKSQSYEHHRHQAAACKDRATQIVMQSKWINRLTPTSCY